MEEEQANIETFLKWATDLGISDSPSGNQSQPPQQPPDSCLGNSLSLSFFPDAGGRGLAAARDLRKGELVLRVPKSALMTSQSLMKDQKLSFSVQKYSHLCSTQLDDAIWTAEKAVGTAKLEWENATDLMKVLELKPQLMSFKAWLWASATISSRTMHVPWDTAGCFCPVGDFFNYAAPGEEQTSLEDLRTDGAAVRPDAQHLDACLTRLTDGVYEGDDGAYCFYARKVYRKGEQVLLSYGTYTNLELLEHYGFLLNENPNDKDFIPLVPDVYSFCSWPKDSLFIHQNGKPSFALLSAMRLWATPPNQRRSVGHLAYSGSRISAANEITVLEWIAKKCRLILTNLSTSIEEDKLLLWTIDKMCDIHAPPMELNDMLPTLKSETSEFLECNGLVIEGFGSKVYLSRKALMSMNRWKLAVQWRLKYKTILDDCILYCTRVINEVSSLDDSAREQK